MSDYGDFARFYDKFTKNVDYPARARYFDAIIQKYNPNAQLLLDLACGTGSLSFELEPFGYDIVAVDNSYEMLSVAMEKREMLESEVLFLCQEMSDLDLFGTIDATVCALDSINHILDEDELMDVFKKVSLFSNKGAVFVFDVNTVYKHKEVLADNCFVYETEETFCAWRNALDKDGVTVDISLDFFDKTENDGLYCRYNSDFSEKAYDIEYLKDMLSQTGFEVKAVFDEDSFLPLRRDSERAIIVAVKK
ncbi:MAG: methyltransferase domain-containing protein [Oscillospiraceae bacterium]|nr:methyltransferase domain-containing protein [Oscillospiraceae bacterium]MBQ3561611.1 methyltransferase domain-containing protein [Oscillospiraceae bacterium]MBQ4118196.1 methyltransferase domain-containing protein [Oscillospiraceae bacterium]